MICIRINLLLLVDLVYAKSPVLICSHCAVKISRIQQDQTIHVYAKGVNIRFSCDFLLNMLLYILLSSVGIYFGGIVVSRECSTAWQSICYYRHGGICLWQSVIKSLDVSS